MASPTTQARTADFEEDAREYYQSLQLEDFMEATVQGVQREVTLTSLKAHQIQRGGFAYFNELLLQIRREGKIEKVVPDNMIVLGNPGKRNRKSWAVNVESCPIFMTMEYVSEDDPEKDYVENFERYEQIFRVPYYLLFNPYTQSLMVYRLNHEGKYYSAQENEARRYLVPELDLEIGLLDGWVRFYSKGVLIPLTDELLGQMNALRLQFSQLQAQHTALEAQHTALEAQHTTLKSEKDALAASHTALLGVLRGLIEPKARSAGRQDILARLASESDPAQLQSWLLELA